MTSTYIDNAAGDLAFHAGQLVEKLLLDRALTMSRTSATSIVTADILQACIDESLVEDLRKHLHERAEHESRKIA